jgi:hypothetical protein
MKETIVIYMVQALMKVLIKACMDEATQKKFVDAVLDAVEAFVSRTDNTLDNELILPLINSIRQNFNIPQQDMSGG